MTTMAPIERTAIWALASIVALLVVLMLLGWLLPHRFPTVPLPSASWTDYLKRVYPLLSSPYPAMSIHRFVYFYGAYLPPDIYGSLVTDTIGPPKPLRPLPIGAPVRPVFFDNTAFIINQYDPIHWLSFGGRQGHVNGAQVEVSHFGYLDDVAIWYYATPGTGIFLDVGTTLVAINKIAALFQMGMSADDVALAIGPNATMQNQQNKEVSLSAFASSRTMTVAQVLQAVGTGSNDYDMDRAANSASYDGLLYTKAKEKGIDTVQMTVQANGNAGWMFEVMDTRGGDGDSRWSIEKQYLTVRDPSNMSTSQPCSYKIPFKRLSCC